MEKTGLMDEESLVLEFIKQQKLAVVSTINKNGKPQAAVVGFGQTDKFELIFGTDNTSRKYSNLQNNPNVAVVIGWDNNITVQLEGVAKELRPEGLDLIRDNYWSKVPSAKKYDTNRSQRYFIIKPTWIRYCDLNQKFWEIITLNF